MYEVTGQQLSSSLTSANAEVFKPETVNLILNLATGGNNAPATVTEVTVSTGGQVTVPAGTDVAMVTINNSGTTAITPPQNIPVMIFNSATGSVEVEFNDTAAAGNALRAAVEAAANADAMQRVVVGPGGNDKIVVKDSKNSYVDGGTGNDTITAGGGNDSIIGGQGNDSLSGGAGNDTIVTGNGNDTVSGGSGFDVAVIAGNAADYVVTVENGHLKLSKSADGSVTDMQNIQYVQLDNNKAVIAAVNKTQAGLAVLYETLFDRTADAGGLDFWFNTSAEGKSSAEIAQMFVDIGGTTFSNLTDVQFVELLYANTFNRVGSQIDASGKEFWMSQLASGHSRGEIAATFANIAVDNFDNSAVTTVGYVKIIDGLI